MTLQELVQETVQALGLDLVEIERSAGGLLRIFIDVPWRPEQAQGGQAGQGMVEQAVTIEDCEKVTRQLQYALQVQDIDYQRLEVSSPGIDRLLRNEQDFERFAGQVVDITLKQPIGANSGSLPANRKKFRGELEKTEQGGWQIVWTDAPAVKPGQRIGKKKQQEAFPAHALGFTLDEVREARLAPIVNFKGRAANLAPGAADAQDVHQEN
ncbi:MAG: ribosome maturation factor RimP [Brachymonas sp.]|nr:ribosome maturation factor RimP [Brachymonas sp.]